MKRLSFALLSVFIVVSLAACSTVEGLGKDIQKAGKKLEKAADK
jgi:predicted small secreted protein